RLDHRGRSSAEPQCRARLYRGLAARHRLRAALPPDGGCSDGRDQPRPGLAVDPARREARRRPRDRHDAVPCGPRRGAREAARNGRGRQPLRWCGEALPRSGRTPDLPRIPDPARLRYDHGGCCLECSASAGGVVAAAEVLIRAEILVARVVVLARIVLVAAGPAGIEAAARIIASGAGVAAREITAGVAAVIVVAD